jgi:glucans biosynthesis protein C
MERRYDIDWVRVIAIGLLLIYHVAIGFQPWGIMIGFITTEKPWMSLWTPMSMLNVWRIPLLFFVSGMGVYFAMQQRNWSQLMAERGARILIPFVVGMFLIVPLHLFMWRYYNQMDFDYQPNPGHLWFLGNIFVYVFVLSPALFYIKRNRDSRLVRMVQKIFAHPLGLFLVIGALMIEAAVIKPVPYEMYAMTWHGFILGLLAFLFGFCFVLTGAPFWSMIQRWRYLFPIVAVALFIMRLKYQMTFPSYLIPVESVCWILTVLAFASKYLNRPSKALTYLSQAAYPVYIIHMAFLYLGSLLIFPLPINVQLQFVLVLLFTLVGCLGFYELIIRRVKLLRPLFGLPWRSKKRETSEPKTNDLAAAG